MRFLVFIGIFSVSLLANGQSASTHYQSPISGHFSHGNALKHLNLEHVVVNSWTSADLQQSTYAINRAYTSNGARIDSSTISVGPVHDNTLLDYYPNPFEETLHLHSKEGPLESIQVLSSRGQVLLEVDKILLTHNLDLSHLQAGIYFLRIKVDGRFIHLSIVKQ